MTTRHKRKHRHKVRMNSITANGLDERHTNESIARRHITSCCLVAADVDKTILAQSTGERPQFLLSLAPQLLQSAKMGMNLAFVTGNSMAQLANRFLKWLVEQLCFTDDLALLPQFHFFCNSGGAYFHFSREQDDIALFLKQHPTGQNSYAAEVLSMLTFKDGQGTSFVKPVFVDPHYLAKTQMREAEVREIERVLRECAAEYKERLRKQKTALAKRYDFSQITEGRKLTDPSIDMRPVSYLFGGTVQMATVQLTLKPVLSFRHGRDEEMQGRLFEHDERTALINRIQSKLDNLGLGRYVARAGGRSSIDVTLEKLDKAYAMEFLIDHLNLQGHLRRGQRFGSNAVYFGDEVIVGCGNDYPVTRIPGLLVFAVNPDRSLIPFLHQVFVPSSILDGPDATADVLNELNKIARKLLASFPNTPSCKRCECCMGSAIDCLKTTVFGDRIHAKTETLKTDGRLKPDEWQILHTLVTLMHRDDVSARRWLRILVEELDAIMTQISDPATHRQPPQALGSSHPDA